MKKGDAVQVIAPNFATFGRIGIISKFDEYDLPRNKKHYNITVQFENNEFGLYMINELRKIGNGPKPRTQNH